MEENARKISETHHKNKMNEFLFHVARISKAKSNKTSLTDSCMICCSKLIKLCKPSGSQKKNKLKTALQHFPSEKAEIAQKHQISLEYIKFAEHTFKWYYEAFSIEELCGEHIPWDANSYM